MAFRLRHWIASIAAGLALISIWLLPPDSFDRRERDVPAAERIRYEELAHEMRTTAEVLRRVLWSDSLSSLTVSEAKDGVSIATPRLFATLAASPESAASPAPVASPTTLVATPAFRAAHPEELRERLDEAVRSEIAGLGPRRGDMLFGYVVQPSDHARLPGMRAAGANRTETYVGSHDGADYCLQVRVAARGRESIVIERKLEGRDLRDASPRSGLLGPCRFYVKYGLAGAGVQRWIEGGGVAFARESAQDLPRRPAVLIDANWVVRQTARRRAALGYNTWAFGRRPVQTDQCLAGDPAGCAHLFENPAVGDPVLEDRLEVVRLSPATSIGPVTPYGSVFPDEAFLLADLESEFGAEAFARFWTSPEDVRVAFETAFGMDVGDWMLRWVEQSVGIEPAGPGLPRSASSGAMLAVMVLLGLAYARHRERTVG